MIGGETRAEVENALRRLVERGARLLSPVAQLGSRWTATCTYPPEFNSPDDTTITLKLSELRAANARRRLADRYGCTVTKLGFTQIVTAHTGDALSAFVGQMLQLGAAVQRSPEEVEDHWEVVLDTSGMQPTERRRQTDS